MDMRAPSDAVLPPLMRDGAELSTAAVAALCEHPQFPAAMRAMMTDNVRLFRGNRILNYVGYDRGRLVIGILALYLHTTRRADDPGSGLTAQRLKSLCVEQELCSTGRARAMLSLLRLFGYVAPAEGSDGRYKFLAPTELLITFLRDRWNAMFDAVALIAPEGAAARAALAHDDFLAAMARAVAEQFRSGVRALDRAPELEPFAEHNAGLMILSSLVTAGEADDTMPPSRPIKLSISELARRFSVSRAHVLRLLRAAEAEGLIKRTTGAQETVTLTPPLARALRESVAMLFLFYARCARTALADVGS
jgi:DNA-binding MarR family transcriptional regulator